MTNGQIDCQKSVFQVRRRKTGGRVSALHRDTRTGRNFAGQPPADETADAAHRKADERFSGYLGLAARQDHVAAQYALGKLFLSDDPELQDPTQGFYWLERAAQNGSDYAAYRLGKEYLSGKNAPKNPERAAECVRMAAECGNPYAQYLLGKLYLSGDGVPQDKDAAYDWFQKAQAQGHDYAGFFMDRIERPEPPNILLSATRLLYHMGKIFQSSAPVPQSCGVQIDRKRLAKLRRIRMAAGHKADDHEQEQSSSTMSMGW